MGVDTNPRYIEAAAVAYPEARFLHLNSDDFRVDLPSEVYDFVILSGVLHHLSDSTVQLALGTAERLLSPSGLLLTIDPTWRSHPVARIVMGLDRGRHIRTADRYKSLIEHVFGQNQCRAIVHHDLLRARCTLPDADFKATELGASFSREGLLTQPPPRLTTRRRQAELVWRQCTHRRAPAISVPTY